MHVKWIYEMSYVVPNNAFLAFKTNELRNSVPLRIRRIIKFKQNQLGWGGDGGPYAEGVVERSLGFSAGERKPPSRVVENVATVVPREADFDLRNSFLSPAIPAMVRDSSVCDDILGGSIYHPVHYSSLFVDDQDNGYSSGGQNRGVVQGRFASAAEAPQLKPSIGRSSHVINVGTILLFYEI
ncbi:hypothetical protein Acr_26g0014000 [Actinidia rufa]|uniref:Uncharacterized protein n=1 Tax=Actinidia rufa TaxID=165716 RepID=A0A7J0H529_9ERIC|nr:hypothetical protein Acr_26g0014000 [Actinidia rufa]